MYLALKMAIAFQLRFRTRHYEGRKEELELNITQQLLVSADGINLLGANKHPKNKRINSTYGSNVIYLQINAQK
jgi:hypothetical protein